IWVTLSVTGWLSSVSIQITGKVYEAIEGGKFGSLAVAVTVTTKARNVIQSCFIMPVLIVCEIKLYLFAYPENKDCKITKNLHHVQMP
ncbi:MAG: hypothetical protein K2K99_05475, partial [Muribaculaceae bacterium]|nr:hypothetical protein [Muribaculaceae bacterium]